MKLRIGSRGSQLALWQSRWVAARLAELGVETELEIIRTTGDKITDVPLAKVGSKGLFTKEIEDALLEGRVDLAVHSLKDLPTILPDGLTVAAIPKREYPHDALVGATLDTLKQGARVGTSSLRRAAQLKRLRPDLEIESVRGNLDTRLRKLDEGQFDAILLAAAGLRRLGWGDRIGELIDPLTMCPAVGQGALAIETRADGGAAFKICSRLDDAASRAAVTAERAVLAKLGGGCQVPIGAHAVLDGETLKLRSVVVDPDSGELLQDECEGLAVDAEALGSGAATRLLASGGQRILASVYGANLPLTGRKIVVTRSRRQAGALSRKLREKGADVIELPVVEQRPLPFQAPDWASYSWVVFTSANAVEPVGKVGAGPKVCAIGPATAAALEAAGTVPDLVAAEAVGEGVAAALASEDLAGKSILIPRAKVAREDLPETLRARGARVDILPVYETVVPDGLKEQALAVLAAARPDAVTLTSSSTATHLLEAVGLEALQGMKVVSIGSVTSETARQLGLTVAAEAKTASLDNLVDAVVSIWA